MLIKTNEEKYQNWKTKKQLFEKKLMPTEPGIVLWTNPYYNKSTEYFDPEKTISAEGEEYEEYLKQKREQRQKQKQKREQKQEQKRKQEQLHIQKLEQENKTYTQKVVALMKLFKKTVKHNPDSEKKYDYIVLDAETTGLYPLSDEILQLSIIDNHGNVLLDQKFNTVLNTEWDDAIRIHGISPKDVNDCPFFYEYLQKIQDILDSAKMIVGYNIDFDLSFLENYGLYYSAENIVDVMYEFAPIYGEWNEKYGDYRWQKLTTCASYYDYKFNAHNSLEDCKATMYCYEKMKEEDIKTRMGN